MATTVHAPYIGQAVYRSFSPLDAGKIIDLLGKENNGFFTLVAVKWVKTGNISTVSTSELKDLTSLLADCQRKVVTHNNTLAKVMAL